MKEHFLTLALFLTTILSYSQTSHIIFLDKNGQYVQSRENAHTIRSVMPRADGLFQINDFSRDSILIKDYTSLDERGLKYQGIVKTYDKKGIPQSEMNYVNGKREGISKSYYGNGQLKEIYEYALDALKPNHPGSSKTVMISFFDSLGVQLVKDGNGLVIDRSGSRTETGRYYEGLKDSIWTGSDPKTDFSYREIFDKGEFVSGTSTQNGKTYNYKESFSLPTFPGGMNSFYQFVGQTYRYPVSAQKNGVSGRVLISFVVDKDGKLSEFKILRDLGMGTGEEAVRVLRRSSDWIPGTQHGIPVRVQYTLPIMLAFK